MTAVFYGNRKSGFQYWQHSRSTYTIGMVYYTERVVDSTWFQQKFIPNIYWRPSLVPSAAVIPAPVAYMSRNRFERVHVHGVFKF